MKILIRMPNWIGDLVLATPVLADLRKAYPDASITAMCQKTVAELLAHDPSIDELFAFQRPQRGFVRRDEQRNIIEKIRAGKYDVGILLTNSFSSAWWFWQGGVKKRIGFAKHWRSWLLNNALKMPQKGDEHEVVTYKRLLKPLGIPISSTAPKLVVLKSEVERAKELLLQRGYREGRPLIGINPGAAYGSAKCWPPERFTELAKRLLQDEESFLVFFGDNKTVPLVKEICAGLSKRAINLAGVTSLRELMSLIHECDLLVTNDSGPMHVAAALDIPVVALFGSTDERATGPYGQNEGVIRKDVSCSPCFKRTCPIDFRCMKGISVDEVFDLVKKRRHV